MAKIRLDLEALAVDTFATDGARRAAGTVHAHATNPWDCVYSATGQNDCPCNSQASCFDCIYSAVLTCQDTCSAPGCDGPTVNEMTCGTTCRWGPGGYAYLDPNC